MIRTVLGGAATRLSANRSRTQLTLRAVAQRIFTVGCGSLGSAHQAVPSSPSPSDLDEATGSANHELDVVNVSPPVISSYAASAVAGVARARPVSWVGIAAGRSKRRGTSPVSSPCRIRSGAHR
ncbi:hypothetical protein [Micromonospora sp. D75]|uniref:hypothetical protein n=1 Tax=Micromonospora sp. D75 TaxID=2824885 RepID=UPI001B35BEED|nr:hypothetical protein [Micromonospora sp. D75]